MVFPFEIGRVAVFHHAVDEAYVPAYHSITVHLHGLRRLVMGGTASPTLGPCIVMSVKGTRVDCACAAGRETWGMVVRTDHWRRSGKEGMMDIRFGDSWMAVPVVTPLDPEHVPGWQRELARMREWYANPIPINVTRLELGVLNILRFVVDRRGPTSEGHSPAYRLKALLDCRETRERSLPSLARETGYSPEHMRSLFRAEFGVTPVAYRARCRMSEAMDHVAGSGLSVKEIAYRLGFKHVSHFSQSFHKAFGLSPRQALAKYRHEPGVGRGRPT